MLKIIGALTVLSGAVLMGITGYYRLSGRVRALCRVQSSANIIEMRLRCMCMPLDDCFADTDEIFSLASQLIKKGISPAEALLQSAEKHAFLQKEDIEIFKSYALGLNSDDCEGQLAGVKMFSARIENALKNAEKDLNTRGKLTLQGSILLGAAVVIILI